MTLLHWLSLCFDWLLVSIALGLLIGAAIRIADRRERDRLDGDTDAFLEVLLP